MFTGLGKATRQIIRHTAEKGVIISVRGERGARRRCGVCGVLCDDLFPQSEPAPLAVFGPTLHSSAAQLNHTPLPWQQLNKKKKKNKEKEKEKNMLKKIQQKTFKKNPQNKSA